MNHCSKVAKFSKVLELTYLLTFTPELYSYKIRKIHSKPEPAGAAPPADCAMAAGMKKLM